MYLVKVLHKLIFLPKNNVHFVTELLESYITQMADSEPEYLQQLSRETHLKVLQPRMMTGHYQGRLLSLFSKIKNPKHILEIGTYTGYSALCLAEGLHAGGKVVTIEINEELQHIQSKYFEQSGYIDKIERHMGDALTIVPGLKEKFDLAFIDGEKTSYPQYLEVVLPKMVEGGLILSDNVLWSGKVAEPLQSGDKATAALIEFNKTLKNHPKLETVILPVRDGLSLSMVL